MILLVVVTIIFVTVVVPLLVNYGYAGKHDTKDIPGKSYVPTSTALVGARN